MTDFEAGVNAIRAAEDERASATAFLRHELDRQLQTLGQGFLAFTEKHGLQEWSNIWEETPEVDWSTRRVDTSEPRLMGRRFRAMRVKSDFSAYIREDGSWILAFTRSAFPQSRGPAGPQARFLVHHGRVADRFGLGYDDAKTLLGAIPEDSDYGDKSYWHLDMTPTGRVGKTIGTRRFSLEEELTRLLRDKLD